VPQLLAGHAAGRQKVYPPWRASVEISLPAVVAVSAVGRTRRGEANMLAMVFLDSRSTNYDSTTSASLTTFNILFENKDAQFRTNAMGSPNA